MSQIDRRDFGLGWQPDADAINAPANAFLRFDNCVLDGHGAVALRQGSAKLNSSVLNHKYKVFSHTSRFEDAFLTGLGVANLVAQITGGDWERTYFSNGYAEGPANHTVAWEAADAGEFAVFNHTQRWEDDYLPAGVTLAGPSQFTSPSDEQLSAGSDGPGNRTANWEDDYISVDIAAYTWDTVISTGADAHSLFTESISGTRYRMAGVDSVVYSNSESIAGNIA